MNWTDILWRDKQKWPINIQKGVPDPKTAILKCKLKLLGNTMSSKAEWLSSTNLTINAGGNMERKKSLFTVDGLDGAN